MTGCSPTGIHYVYDTYSLANVTAKAVIATGGDSWFFVTADYAVSHAFEKMVGDVAGRVAAKSLARLERPWTRLIFSSFLLQAQASKAKIVALANAGTDTVTSIKQAQEFGLVAGGQRLVGLNMFLSEIDALGLEAAQGSLFATSFYWDAEEDGRKWSKRYFERMQRMPNDIQAGLYSATTHYLKGVQAAGPVGIDAVRWMKNNEVKDFYAKPGRIGQNGRMYKDMYLVQVKKTFRIEGALGRSQDRGHLPGQPGLQAGIRKQVQASDVASRAEKGGSNGWPATGTRRIGRPCRLHQR